MAEVVSGLVRILGDFAEVALFSRENGAASSFYRDDCAKAMGWAILCRSDMTRRCNYFLSGLLAMMLMAGCAHSGGHSNAARDASEVTDQQDVPALTDADIRAAAHFATALSLDLQDKPDEALDQYIRSAQDNPAFEPVVLESVRRLLKAREFDRTIAFVTNALAKPGATPMLYPMLGLAYISTSRTNEAIAVNRLAVQKMPDNLVGTINLVSLYSQAGRTNEAVAALRKAGESKDADSPYWIAYCDLLTRVERQNLLSAADIRKWSLAALDQAASTAPRDPAVLQRIADGYLSRSQPDKARPIYETLLKEFPESPAIREKLVNLYLRTGKNPEAVKLLDGLRRDNPTDPQNYYFLGALAYEARDFAKATENYETALRLNPGIEQIYYDLAGLKLGAHKPEEALDLLQTARAKFKLNFALEFYTGLAMAAMERFTQAINHYTSAEILARVNDASKLNHVFYFQMGSAHERAGNFPEAVALLKKSIELSPKFDEAMNYLGYMWADRNENLREAHDLIDRALKEEPENPAYLDSLAWIFYREGNFEEALRHIRTAIAKSPEADAALLDHMGDILKALKRDSEAVATWRQSLQAHDDPKVREKVEH